MRKNKEKKDRRLAFFFSFEAQLSTFPFSWDRQHQITYLKVYVFHVNWLIDMQRVALAILIDGSEAK